MIKLKFYSYFKNEFYFSRIIILQLIIIFGWWRLWRISPEFIHISTFDILSELPYFIYMVPYLFLLIIAFLFLKTQKNIHLILYSLVLLFSMILDVSTYHHGEFTLIIIVLHHLLNTKFKLNEKHLIAGLYLLCLIPKINYESIIDNNGHEMFEIMDEKQNSMCYPPVTKTVKKLLKRYKGNIPIPTNQKFNLYVKEV